MVLKAMVLMEMKPMEQTMVMKQMEPMVMKPMKHMVMAQKILVLPFKF